MHLTSCTLLLAALLVASPCFAKGNVPTPEALDDSSDGNGKNPDPPKQSTPPDTNSFFNDGNWGVGLAVINSHSSGQVTDASIRNGVVSVDDVQKWSPKLLLERHYYAYGDINENDPKQLDNCATEEWGRPKKEDKRWYHNLIPRACIGGFIGVGLGSNQIIDFVGAGIIFGFGKASKPGVSNARPHNIGFGIARQFHQKLLADGFSAGSAPPNGETQVQYKYTDTNAFFLFYTYAP